MNRAEKKRNGWAICALAALMGLAGCGAPNIQGLQPAMVQPGKPAFRDLADIPERPATTDSAANAEAVQMLSRDRAETARDVKTLRSEPVVPPEPVMPSESVTPSEPVTPSPVAQP